MEDSTQLKTGSGVKMDKTMDWSILPPCDIRRQVAWVARQSPDGYSWPTYERFLELNDLPDNIHWKKDYYACGYVHFMYMGKWAGWWELSWDMFPDDEDLRLYPIKLVVVSLSKTEHKAFPSLLAELDLFKSSSEAKKNGWNKPLEEGDFFFKKKTYILRIID